MTFKIIITETEPNKGTADIDIDGNLGDLSTGLVDLMEKQDSVQQVLTNAVDQYREKHSTYP